MKVAGVVTDAAWLQGSVGAHSERAVLPPGLLSLPSRTSSWDRSSRSCTQRRPVLSGWLAAARLRG